MLGDYEFGRKQEEKVARFLRKRGASVKLSRGSKGPADLFVSFPTRTKWTAQVKATATNKKPK
jgi:N-acetylmuramoyl-L-alanine amidase